MTEPITAHGGTCRITVSTADLRRAVKLVARYAATRCPLPICENILITSGGTPGLSLAATDLGQFIHTAIAAQRDRAFAACVSAKMLRALVENLKNQGEVELIACGNGGMAVRASGKVTELRGMPPADFPILPQGPDETQAFIIEADALRRLVGRTAFAAAKEDRRMSATEMMLAGIHLESADGHLIATAGDGYRLATAREATVSGADVTFTAYAKTLKRAAASLDGVVYAVHSQKDNLLHLTRAGTLITTRLIEGTYPDYRAIIPADSAVTTRATIERDELLAAIKAATAGARLAAKDKHSDFVPVVRIEADRRTSVRTASEDADGNEFAVRADATVQGDFITVGFSPEYLVEAVKALTGGVTASRTKTTATTTVNVPPSQSLEPTASPEPITKPIDPMVARAALESARLRLGVTERLFGKASPQYLAAQARLHAAGTAQNSGAVVSQPVCEPPRVRPTVVRRTPDPAAPIPADSSSTITLSFTGPNSACLIRGATEASGTHVVMPMAITDTSRKARDERAA